MKMLIDVSYHNGDIDFKKVKKDGIDGVIIRAGYGAGNVDKKFKSYIKAAIKAGLPVGIYWFSYAYNKRMARKEASYCLETIKPYKKYITLPVFYDWEYDSMRYAQTHNVDPGKKSVTDFNLIFCKKVKKAGYKAGYYIAGLPYRDGYIDKPRLKGYYSWFARYTSEPQSGYSVWQYTENGKVDGIEGRVDKNKVLNNHIFKK